MKILASVTVLILSAIVAPSVAFAALESSITPILERQEVVATDVDIKNDQWGPHKTRIIRLSSGDIFLTYKKSNGNYSVMHRPPEGTWKEVATGKQGYEPVNILRGLNDTINIFVWPGDAGTLNWIHSSDTGKTFATDTVPGEWYPQQGYAGAGVNSKGYMVIAQTGSYKPGHFLWGVYNPHTGTWKVTDTQIDYRYTYGFYMPGENNDLTITATRDIPETVIGCSSNQNTYAFDSIKYYHINNLLNPSQPQELEIKHEPCVPGSGTTNIIMQGQDSYIDSFGRTHLLYADRGQGRHAIIHNGKLLKDVPINVADAFKDRIVQDTTGKFYLLSMSGNTLIAQARATGDRDSTKLDRPLRIDLGKYPLTGWGQFRIASPRTGTPIANFVDGHYISGDSIVYFRLRLH